MITPRLVAGLAIACAVALAAPAWAKEKAHEDETPVQESAPVALPPPPAGEIGVSLPTRPGATETFLFAMPPDPKAVVILFSGGEGVISVIGVAGEGLHPTLRRGGNFLIRTRSLFVAAGFATVALDAPSDHNSGIDEAFRKSADHATDVSAVVAWVRQKTKVPVWLVGTSMGTISAASVAIRLGSAVDGLVLTSTVSAGGRNSPGRGVSTLDLDKIAVPALVMDHVNESCPSSPSSNADIIAKHMSKSPRVAVKMIEGGKPPISGPCEPFSYHGYYGAEDKAVDAIAAFILQK